MPSLPLEPAADPSRSRSPIDLPVAPCHEQRRLQPPAPRPRVSSRLALPLCTRPLLSSESLLTTPVPPSLFFSTMLCLGYPLPAFSPTGFPHLTPPRLRPCPCLLSSEAVHGHTAREEPQPPQPPTLPRPAALSGAPSCLLPQGREEAWG